MSAVILDWDGTLVSCEEKIDATIRKICSDFPEIQDDYHAAISKRVASPGWIRRGFITSLPEDYFTYHFGIVAKLLATSWRRDHDWDMTGDDAWSIVLTKFKELYRGIPSQLLVDHHLLMMLARQAEVYIVSNSNSKNIRHEAQALGIGNLHLRFIGDAKKYYVESLLPDILGISVTRPRYREVLSSIAKRDRTDIIVVGDNFSLDLTTPISMGIRVAYIPNPLTPRVISDFIRDQHIPSGTINKILQILIQKKEG